MKRVLVTGGTGFIGAALVKRLVRDGHEVRVLDDNSRGAPRRLEGFLKDVEIFTGDVCNSAAVEKALQGIDVVHHLAYVNGTANFYKMPERVLEIAVKGIINVLDGCLRCQVEELYLASSSEVYQQPPRIPTNENVPLIIPDVMNPRFSYGGGKIISELLAINYGRKLLERVCIYRPHNVYGPDMGWEHVIPQFVVRLYRLAARETHKVIDFPIQGTGQETRSFCYVDDFIDGVVLVQDSGEHLGIYHIGTKEEITMSHLAHEVATSLARQVRIVPGTLLEGSVPRRCPDIAKLEKLGYRPSISLAEGVARTADWYWRHMELAPAA